MWQRMTFSTVKIVRKWMSLIHKSRKLQETLVQKMFVSFSFFSFSKYLRIHLYFVSFLRFRFFFSLFIHSFIHAVNCTVFRHIKIYYIIFVSYNRTTHYIENWTLFSFMKPKIYHLKIESTREEKNKKQNLIHT